LQVNYTTTYDHWQPFLEIFTKGDSLSSQNFGIPRKYSTKTRALFFVIFENLRKRGSKSEKGPSDLDGHLTICCNYVTPIFPFHRISPGKIPEIHEKSRFP
jgi:hypothetical protein